MCSAPLLLLAFYLLGSGGKLVTSCYLVTLLHFTFLAQVEKKLASAHLAFHIQFQNQVSALQIGVVRLKGYHAKKAKRIKKVKKAEQDLFE